MIFDIATSLLAALLGAGNVVTTVYRWRVTRQPIMLWLAGTLTVFVSLYLIFTYNAFFEISNRPYRYYLRFAHMAHYVVLMLLQIILTKIERAAAKKALQVINEGHHG